MSTPFDLRPLILEHVMRTTIFSAARSRPTGHRLQFLAFKLRELQSVRYRRYKSKLHPDFRTSTIGGTDGYLAKVRNDVKTEQDLIDRWVFDETKWTKSQTSG
ncbi:hypothetical protein DFQ26_004878 [Actinomortierella ambigua]|nr:hypothetical protein DFQ26_004878 [Actinomortierella ambigua]